MTVQRFFMKVFPYIKNKFFLTTAFFIVWVIFFDQYNLVSRVKNNQKLSQLEKEKKHYINEIEKNTRMLNELKGDNETLEKFAREQYLMKKNNEDIYLVIEE
jgi:cell division protein DivIC